MSLTAVSNPGRRSTMRFIGALALLLASFSAGLGPATARTTHAGLCFGRLHVTPTRVHLGGMLTLRGSHYTCTSPQNKLLSTATVFMYMPKVGFTMYQVHIHTDGTYSKRVRVRRRLYDISMINGAKQRKVNAPTGTYYFAVRVFDVYVPPPSQALAHVQVLR